jgi:hypothetical protein
MIVVARDQGHRKPAQQIQLFKDLPQAHVATPALVLAEIPADQQQIRWLLQLPQGLPQAFQQGPTGRETAAMALGVGQQMGIAELKDPLHASIPGCRPKLPLLQKAGMAAIPPGTRQRCELCQVEIQGLVGGIDQVHFSQGQPSTRSKLWARVCQYLRTDEQKGQCLNQDPTLRGELRPGDAYAEPPSVDLGSLGA